MLVIKFLEFLTTTTITTKTVHSERKQKNVNIRTFYLGEKKNQNNKQFPAYSQEFHCQQQQQQQY